jgi:hypothetical protein
VTSSETSGPVGPLGGPGSGESRRRPGDRPVGRVEPSRRGRRSGRSPRGRFEPGRCRLCSAATALSFHSGHVRHVEFRTLYSTKDRPKAAFRESNVRRRPTLPRGLPRSTIGAEGLNFRVRNGAGCFPFAMVAETLWIYSGEPPVYREQHSGRVATCGVGQALGLLVPVGFVHHCLRPPAYQPSVLLGALPG